MNERWFNIKNEESYKGELFILRKNHLTFSNSSFWSKINHLFLLIKFTFMIFALIKGKSHFIHPFSIHPFLKLTLLKGDSPFKRVFNPQGWTYSLFWRVNKISKMHHCISVIHPSRVNWRVNRVNRVNVDSTSRF